MKTLLLLILLFAFNCFSQPLCVDVLNDRRATLSLKSESEALDFLALLETEIQSVKLLLENERSSVFQGGKDKVNALEVAYEDVFQALGRDDLGRISKKVFKIKNELIGIKGSYLYFKKANTLTQVEELFENPLLVVPQKVYRTQNHEGKSLAISFSKSMVEEVFFSKSDLRKQAVKMSLKAITKGVLPSFTSGTNGIKFLGYAFKSTGVFEITIIAHSIGQFRFLGYFQKETGVFRVVYFFENTDHTKSIVERHAQVVLNKMHVGEY